MNSDTDDELKNLPEKIPGFRLPVPSISTRRLRPACPANTPGAVRSLPLRLRESRCGTWRFGYFSASLLRIASPAPAEGAGSQKRARRLRKGVPSSEICGDPEPGHTVGMSLRKREGTVTRGMRHRPSPEADASTGAVKTEDSSTMIQLKRTGTVVISPNSTTNDSPGS